MKRLLHPLAILALLAISGPVLAVQPDEIMADPGLEARARMISREIRCPVCQGENIDDSNAVISRDLRLIIRERLLAGDGNEEVIDFIVARYGEFVLFNPRAEGATLVLWLAGPVMLLLAGGGVLLMRRRGTTGSADDSLTAEEEARLAALLAEDAGARGGDGSAGEGRRG